MAQKIWVLVKPQSRKENLSCLGDGTYQAAVQAPAQDGKANQALIALLAGHFSLPKAKIKIIRGLTARKKLVEIG
jgi:uncharacterized protein YggU (UPF0235/DUF167 family)